MKLKKICALALAGCLAACLGAPAAATAAPESTLRFNNEGTFKILVLADTQDDATPEKAMLAIENAALDADKWDLVVFTGDQIDGRFVGKNEEKVRAAISAVLQPVADRGLPFAAVFGNHDDEGGVSKETQMAFYKTFPGCLATEGEDMTGCGSYALTVKNSAGEDALCLWFFDSNTYDETGVSYYDWVHDDQLEWFNAETQKQRDENGGAALPGYVFQHIVVPEIYDALSEVPEGTEGAVKGYGIHEGSFYALNDEHFSQGSLGEGPCSPDFNGGEFEAWKNNGSIVAAFFGHDHVNSYVGEKDGIGLTTCPGCTYFSYGAAGGHGVRSITISEADPTHWETQVLFYSDLCPGEKEPGFPASSVGTWPYPFIAGALAVLVIIAAAVVLLVRHRRKSASQTAARQK